MAIVSGKMIIHFAANIESKEELLEEFSNDMARWGTVELANLPDERLELDIHHHQIVYMEDEDGHIIHEVEEEKV